jgi:hypothetical protein
MSRAKKTDTVTVKNNGTKKTGSNKGKRRPVIKSEKVTLPVDLTDSKNTEGLTGAKVKSMVLNAKFQANKDYKATEGGIYKMRKHFATYGENYLRLLNEKHGKNVSMDQIVALNPSELTTFLTDKEREQTSKKATKLGKDPILQPVFTFYLMETLISRYISKKD